MELWAMGASDELFYSGFWKEEIADVRPGYSLEYCGLTAVDLHGRILQAAYAAAAEQA